MSRTMIDANKHVFSALTDYVATHDDSITIPDGIRYIKTTDTEKTWLQDIDISPSYNVFQHLKISTAKYQGKEYFIVSGWEYEAVFSEILSPVPLNAGLVTALLFEMNVSIKQESSPLLLFNEILHFYRGDDSGYSGHDFDDVIRFFEPLKVYEITNDSPLNSSDFFRLAGYFFCEGGNHLFLPFQSRTIEIFKKAFLEGVSNVPYENLLLSLTSIHWRFSFLDIYRCIERLLPIISLDELHQVMGTSISLLQFAEEVENKIRWWPKEAEAIERMMKDSPSDAQALFRKVKNVIYGSSDGELGDFFYKIRNSIVHYRPGTISYRLSKNEWNELVQGGLLLVEHWYNRYNSRLSP